MRNFPLTWVEIDLNCLRHNLRAARKAVGGSRAGVLAVVKADAYGHGMQRVARALAGEGVKFFGVATIDEACELRRICKKERILVLGSFHPAQIPLYIRCRVIPTVSSLEDAQALENALRRGPACRTGRGGPHKKFPVHVKIDTGMGRLGVWHEEAKTFFEKIKKRRPIFVEGIYTHFAKADHADRSFTRVQLLRFTRAVAKIKALGFGPKFFHAANSLGLLRFKEAHFNLVRPGIVLYGINPSQGKSGGALRPVLSLKTRISFLKKVKKGATISYGGTYRAPRDTRVATLSIGYSHGYRVGLSNKAFVVIRGRKCPVIGRVTMDQTLVDVGHVPGVRRWDEVTVIGSQGGSQVSAVDLAEISQTIPYEIVCSIHSRIPRIYKDI